VLTDESATALAEMTAGHPQRAAMVAHFLWRQPRLDETALLAAEAEALHAVGGEMEQLWDDLTRAQRQVIGLVADGATELLARPSLEAMGLGKSTAQQARNVLEAEGHLRREGNRLVLVDPFLARWLRG
jgi:hypothetical protein